VEGRLARWRREREREEIVGRNAMQSCLPIYGVV
jgi:hypothetical protein